MAQSDSTKVAEEEKEAELIETVQARLDALNNDGSDDEGDEGNETGEEEGKEEKDQQAEKDESTPDDDNQADEDDSTPVDKTGEADETDDATKNEDGDKNTEEVSLPDAFYRAAVHQGWKPEEIKGFFEAKPELAIQTFGKIHESTNKLSADFANLGRAQLKPADKTADSQTATEVNTEQDVDLTALRDEYGADSTIVKFAENMQAKAVANARVEPVADEQQQTPQRNSVVQTAVDQFFTDPALKPYAEFYGEGKDENALTLGQSKQRWEVLEMADNIIIGAQQQGRGITIPEAMEMAHMLVSAPVQKKALRAELTAKIVKKSKGVSLKPAKAKAIAPDKDAKVSEKELEEKVQVRLDKIYRGKN